MPFTSACIIWHHMATADRQQPEWSLQLLPHGSRLPEEPAAADAGLGTGTGDGTGTMMGLMTGEGTIGTTLRRFSGGGGASVTTYMQKYIRPKSSNQVVKHARRVHVDE